MCSDATTHVLEGLQSSDAGEAWLDFLDLYGPVLYHVALIQTQREDAAADCYIYVCEKLADNHFKRLLEFDPGGNASFTTWLRVVARNLCFDWHRMRFGRHRPFKGLGDLSPLESEVYKLRFTNGASHDETLQQISRTFPAVGANEVFAIEERLEKSLNARQRWILSSRRQVLSSVSAVTTTEEGHPVAIEIADPNPNQEVLVVSAEEQLQLRKAVAALPPDERLLLQLRFEQDLSLDEVARLCGLGDGQRVHRRISAVLKKLRFSMR